MQSASKGLGHFASGVRSLHVYAHVPRPTVGTGAGAGAGAHHHPSRPPAVTVAGRILHTTRTAFTRFLAHLATPGFTHPVAWGQTARNLSTRVNASVRPPTIQQGLSLPARQALSRPRMGPPFVPRATPASKSTVQVGLGTARNFTTARPLFQQFAQNVPVAGRAIYEADWNIEKRKMKDKKRELNSLAVEKENIQPTSALRAKSTEKPVKVKELERYFPVADSIEPDVITILLVPLAPTPTSRLPLTETHGGQPTLLVVSDLQDILSSHRIHSLRVSSLFARLDACGVWEKGAAFSALGDASGLCTVLRVEFGGWTEQMVRDVMGDAGKGWCRIVEMKEDEGRSVLDERSTPTPISSIEPEHDPATSVVLPTLDFSASFHAACESVGSHSSPPPSPPLSGASSPMHSVSEISLSPSSDFEIDFHSDGGSDLDDSFGNFSEFDSGSGSGSMISFSSDFLQRSANVSHALD